MSQMAVVEGSEAVALAVKLCRPQVISAFPISPQTHIIERLAKFVAEGELNAVYVPVESEFSAASVLAGASAAKARAYTASSSQGLLLMTEVLYASAGMRLPFVMTGVNRTVSSPISIQVDHQDTISLRDSGVIQIYVESNQEAYDVHIAAFKIAEDPKVLLPVMVCMDGWVLTHSYERIEFVDAEQVDRFLPPFEPANFLDVDDPKSWGSIAEEDMLMEFKYAMQAAQAHAKTVAREVFSELSKITGRDYGGLIETYQTRDADVILVAMGSVVGTAKEAVDELRSAGKKVGLVKIRCYRPFPYEDIMDAIRGARAVAVIDADYSIGSGGAMALDLKAKLCGRSDAPTVVEFVAGLGGRDINKKTVAQIVRRTEEFRALGQPVEEAVWVDLDPAILS